MNTNYFIKLQEVASATSKNVQKVNKGSVLFHYTACELTLIELLKKAEEEQLQTKRGSELDNYWQGQINAFQLSLDQIKHMYNKINEDA